jgi:catechol 2,3-dioxygenase-like lactoylglutathione lyase family enzyme
VIRIKLTSVMVDDQNQALRFYTDVLGFVKKTEIPMGQYRWLTVVSPAAPDEVELALEPMGAPFAVTYQKALHDAGIPATAFAVDDLDAEYERLRKRGVVFKSGPRPMGPTRIAVLDDTCGNYIQLFQPPG